jgi:hypothetical protein
MTPITIPPLEELRTRLKACREEMLALRRLERLARAADLARDIEVARQAHERQLEGGRHD